MILTGPAIRAAVASGDLTIDPYDPAAVGPNSYDYHLHDELLLTPPRLDTATEATFTPARIPPHGVMLEPGRLYLALTRERTASDHYAQWINGNLSVGTLGIWVHVSAPLAHSGSHIRWTLEVRVTQPVRVFAGMPFGKIVFLVTHGPRVPYHLLDAKYATDQITPPRLAEEFSAAASQGVRPCAS